MSAPSTNNKLADVVNQILSALIKGTGTQALEAALIAEQPWLALPFVKQLFTFIVDHVAAYIYSDVALMATKIIIDAQVSTEEVGANAAFQNLQMAIAGDDQPAIYRASADLSAAYGNLIHYDGSSSP